ncbi:hypothetical protein JOC70_001312 [Clostridium pascui]|uniref:capsular polysaccharide synthesis protein n=1 Tax=Clostridium pascui TaxID=46609 RepID=UPI0019596AF5|nr:capsular polysaccharide synthesis protein [Clostridium pascui]MBM7869842.1 hypothetical protein [Clostridium pascui]
MSNLKKTFEKQGGWNLIKQYWQSGAFFTAVGEFLLLGKSRTALEILRLSTHLKVKQKLQKKYRETLNIFDSEYNETLAHEGSNKIWVCWFQGIENAPVIVQKCYESILRNLPGKEVVLITTENMAQYVQFPDYIMEKWKSGQITNTHMTDLLRLELLIQNGGMWLDATVLCTDSNIPDYFFDSDLFFYQCLKPGRDGHSHINSSWLMSSKTNNKVLMATRYLCYEYWKENTQILDYFLLHDFISIVLEYYPEDWRRIVPSDNATPHILLLRLFDQYDEQMWKAIKAQTPFHKMTYKFKEDQTEIAGTYYQEIFGESCIKF